MKGLVEMKYIYSLRNAMDELISEKNAYVLGEDVMEPYGGAFKVTKGLSEKYPSNVIGTPMCEQGFTAISVGMALMGEYVIEEIMFGDFVTLTADQLVNHAAKFHELYGQKLHLVVRTPSGGYRGYGATHSQSLEKLLLGIPGLRVAAPNVFMNVGAFLKTVISDGIPTLFVENKLDYGKELVLEDFDVFKREEMGNNIRISVKGERPEVTILTYGGTSNLAVEAAKKLMYEEEIAVEVVLVSELSRKFTAEEAERLFRTSKVVIAEEGTGGFGFSAQVAATLAERGKQIKTVTSSENVIPASALAESQVLIQAEDIFNAAVSLV